jgi:hypothetical protein
MLKPVFVAVLSSIVAVSCLDSLQDYEECKEIENARCALRQKCDESGNQAFQKEFPNFDFATCVAYAKEHCRTRKIGSTASWKPSDVHACAQAISALDLAFCSELDPAVDETESAPLASFCWFIEAPEEEPVSDAGNDTVLDGG